MDLHINPMSFFNVLFSPSGLIIVVMAVVCAGMLALFLPGGFRKIISVVAVFATAGLAIFLLRNQKNRLIGDYNLNVDKYLDVVAEKKRIDTENAVLRREIEALEGSGDASKQQLGELMQQYESSLKQANKKSRLRAELSSEIERNAEKLDSGYEIGSSPAFRRRWQEIREMAQSDTEQEPLPAAPIVEPPPPVPAVVDTDPEPAEAVSIDIRFEGYRLKGDIT
ncbi:MAG: hypothetical protein KTR17_00340 [Cellvibrionaceae bacterium]|nr:hypothetical protein [Cellvibrionaceae bacterium]